jgi:transcriptional activator of cad operon
MNKRIISEQPLPFLVQKVLWLDKNTERLAISSFEGQLYYFDIKLNALTREEGLSPQLREIFYDCGEQCFYMHQVKLNVLDIIEVPNPFNDKVKLASTYFESKHSELYPVYNKTGDSVYFIRRDDNGVHMMRHTPESKGEKLFSVNSNKSISQLSIDPIEQHIAGKIEGRAFIYNLHNQQLQFITSQEELVSISSWSRDGQFLYFSRLDNPTPVLLKYDVKVKKTVEQYIGIKGYYQLFDGRDFIIDKENNLFHQVDDNEKN